MGLMKINETIEYLEEKQLLLSNRQKEFVVQFALKTDDKELTAKLVEELAAVECDQDEIIKKF